MGSLLNVRAYASMDRTAVRAIAFDTGFMGESIDWLWRDRESFADLVTNYYLHREPQSVLVAEDHGAVVGYLTGCVDSQRCRGAAAAEIRRLVRRGALFRPGVAGFFWRSAFDILRDREALEDALSDPRWPAHLHINLLPAGRGRGLGRRLMHAWLDRLRAARVPGVHLGTLAENHNAIGFFESCGFTRHGRPRRVPGLRTRDGRRMHLQWMVQALTA
jgi:ribosomal protein S18 acetylase RimI-like enzyme